MKKGKTGDPEHFPDHNLAAMAFLQHIFEPTNTECAAPISPGAPVGASLTGRAPPSALLELRWG